MSIGIYVAYLLLSIGLTIAVGMALSRSGRVVLTEVLGGNQALAGAVNRLLIVGFYLLTLGFIALVMRPPGAITSGTQAAQVLSIKIGEVLLVLGAAGTATAGAAGRTLTSVADPELTPRAEQTKAAIVQSALRLFRRSGYEATTMRAIAQDAGVSTGNAYYYFGSKEELIQQFYVQNSAEHLTACRPVLDTETDFAARLRGTLRALIDVSAPYHDFAARFFKHAAEPSSPLSPLSKESSPARDAAIALYAEVIDGSSLRLDRELRAELPELLWLYSLGVILYWVHDTSPECARTYLLIDRTVPLAARLVSLARSRLLRSTMREVVSLIHDLRS